MDCLRKVHGVQRGHDDKIGERCVVRNAEEEEEERGGRSNKFGIKAAVKLEEAGQWSHCLCVLERHHDPRGMARRNSAWYVGNRDSPDR